MARCDGGSAKCPVKFGEQVARFSHVIHRNSKGRTGGDRACYPSGDCFSQCGGWNPNERNETAAAAAAAGSIAGSLRPSVRVRARQMKPLITDNDHVPKESCGSGRRGRNEGEMVVRPVACGIEIGMRRRPPVWNLRRLQFICDVDIRPIQRNVHHDTGYARNTGYPHNLREIRQ